MKRIFIIHLSVMISFGIRGQVLSNIFSHKSADLKSMGKQIMLLKLYMGWLEKGYRIVRSGLTFIGEVRQGEFNLHSLFFSSLGGVNPAIKRSTQVASVIEYQQRITGEFRKILRIKNLTPDEMGSLQEIKENLLKDCANCLENLVDVISDHVYQMSDDERIKRIDGICLDMEKDWVLASALTEEAQMLNEQRQWEAQDNKSLQNLEK